MQKLEVELNFTFRNGLFRLLCFYEYQDENKLLLDTHEHIRPNLVYSTCRKMIKEMGRAQTSTLYTDSSAAKGTDSRVGSGRLKHVETNLFWVQENGRKAS